MNDNWLPYTVKSPFQVLLGNWWILTLNGEILTLILSLWSPRNSALNEGKDIYRRTFD